MLKIVLLIFCQININNSIKSDSSVVLQSERKFNELKEDLANILYKGECFKITVILSIEIERKKFIKIPFSWNLRIEVCFTAAN